MQTLDHLDLMFSVINCNILVMNGWIGKYIYSHTLIFSYSLIIMLHQFCLSLEISKGRVSWHFLLSGSKIRSSLPFTIPLSESMISSTVCVMLNCIRRNIRQFRWIKLLSAILRFVISTVYIASNCMRRNTRQFRWTKKLVLFMLHRTVWGATPASSDKQKY